MRPLTRWLESQELEDAELRMALLDAREGPSAAQAEVVARRVAERAATLEALRGEPRARRALSMGQRVWLSVGLALVIGAVSGSWLAREQAAVAVRPIAPVPQAHPSSAATPASLATTPAAEKNLPAPAAEVRRAKAPTRARRPARAETPPGDEIPLLQEARRALLGRPEAALELAHKHRALFPHGVFGEERSSIEVEALWRLSRLREARAAWEEFARHYPHSPYRQRLERLWSGAAQAL